MCWPFSHRTYPALAFPSPQVNATLMNIADNPTNVQLPGVYKTVRGRRTRRSSPTGAALALCIRTPSAAAEPASQHMLAGRAPRSRVLPSRQ